MAANSVYQYEQPRCPDNWTESERRFYTRLIQVLDDIYARYGRIDEKMLSNKVIDRIDNSTEVALDKMVANTTESGALATDSLESTFAYMVTLSTRYGDFEFADIQNLVAKAMVLEQGLADDLFVRNLRVTFAQMASAAISDLCIQASDGNYYRLDVDLSGNVIATATTVTAPEIEAGETSDGKTILATNIVADSLNTSNLVATYALLNKLDAARINVDELFARDAFVTALTTSKIFADGGTLQLVAKETNKVSRWFEFANDKGFIVRKPAYTDEEGVYHPASVWYTVTDETGYHIYNTEQTEPIGSFQRGGLKTTGVRIGDIICQQTSSGGWVWTDPI